MPDEVDRQKCRGPNFLIGGAPKSGTTAMANYLRQHAEAYVSDVKEPFYFATDMPAMRRSTRVETEAAYRKLFCAATEQHRAVGEGSTLYLYSETAIEESIRFNPHMKFIFMVRRPSEIAHAYHMQMIFHEYENVLDFEEAWKLQPSRRETSSLIPARCREPKLLQYGDVAAVGTQLQRAFDLIPAAQRLTIVFDDFAKDTRSAYGKTLRFLGLSNDARECFSKDNAAMQSRSPHLTRLLRSRPAMLATLFLKKRLDGPVYSMARRAKHSLMFRQHKRSLISPQFDERLHEHFRPEVEILERLLQRDLDHWKTVKQRGASAE